MHIIGITGTQGSGKGEVVNYLEKKGFIHFSARTFLLEEMKRRNVEIIRDNMTTVANDLRKKYSPSYIIESLFKQAEASGKNCVIESVRALGELSFLRKQNNFYLLAVAADTKIRYERILQRKSVLDYVTFEQFLHDEKREGLSKDPAEGSIDDCVRLADFILDNNGTKEELYERVEGVLKKIENK